VAILLNLVKCYANIMNIIFQYSRRTYLNNDDRKDRIKEPFWTKRTNVIRYVLQAIIRVMGRLHTRSMKAPTSRTCVRSRTVASVWSRSYGKERV